MLCSCQATPGIVGVLFTYCEGYSWSFVCYNNHIHIILGGDIVKLCI